jgi:tRNA dimethylallyltransferase
MAVRLLVIVGPTACGKTRLAVDVAHALGTEILSADSRQVYRGLDIGAGKDLDEYSRVTPPVPYHLIDVADPRSVYSVYHFQRDSYRLLAAKARQEPWQSGTPLVMAGGSGLYVEAVLRGFRIANVPEDVELRKRLMRRGRESLIEELRGNDTDLLGRTDLTSKKRVVRALEIAAYAREHEVRYTEPPRESIDHALFCVEIPRPELHRRIDERLETRLREGLIAEVEGLLAAGVTAERMAQLGLEYREVTAYLTGSKSERRMIDDLRLGIRRFAKRQLTWFRGLPRRGIPVTPIAPDDAEALIGSV